jgi:hypothetical protein
MSLESVDVTVRIDREFTLMARVSFEDGVLTHKCDDWIDFNDFITERLERSPTVWRGQQDAAWPLEPSLARTARRLGRRGVDSEAHLARFRYATRGRRGPTPRRILEDKDDEWWALGQHHRLATPLLDWTHSPYVAAFFAYAEQSDPAVGLRVVYGLVEHAVARKSAAILKEWSEMTARLERRHDERAEELGSAETITFIRPFTDENQRLISQNALFTRSLLNIDIEQWIRKHFRGEARIPKLYKLLLPTEERLTALRSLNRMNINFLSLYPDIEGASLHCNMALEIEHY